MKLSEIFSQLTTGELSQVGLGGAKTGGIAEADFHKVLGHVNLGLSDLYSRFTVRQGLLTLVLQPNKVSYSLSKAFAVSNQRSREVLRYILDSSEEPFLDDVTKVERVLTDAGHELVLNVENNPESIITPGATILRVPKIMVNPGAMDVPDHLKTTQLEVFYRAAAIPIVKGIGPFDPSRVEVDIPRTYLQALLYFVAARVHAPMGLNQEFYSGNVYGAKYEQECARLLNAGLQIDQQRESSRLERNGWV